MSKPLQTTQIARFVLQSSYNQLDLPTRDQLKKHVLDSVASLIYATGRPIIQKLVRHLRTLSTGGRCSVPLLNHLPVDRAAQLYTGLNRSPDFMDNFLGKEATCHPSWCHTSTPTPASTPTKCPLRWS